MSVTTIKSIRDLDIRGKAVFLRLDFNVPVSGQGEARVVEDDTRIREALPTIRYALEQGARVIIGSHFGRPDGKKSPDFSMEPVANRLAELLEAEVTLADDCIGEGIEMMARTLTPGRVLLLENLRFYAGEEKNEPAFVNRLSRLADVYVTDAFGTAHRMHASTYGLPLVMPARGMGFLIEKELEHLQPLISDPARPFVAILGGSKVTDKIKTIEFLLTQVQSLLIGGAMAHAFWASMGRQVPEGAKQPKPDDVEAAGHVLKLAKKREIQVLVPSDTLQGFDIGPETVREFTAALRGAKTVFWNGPLGWFEKPEYAGGTFAVAEALAAIDALKIVGGGDTVSAVKKSGFAEKFTHLSTGGGAVLEYLEGAGLPGIDVLKQGYKPKS